MATRSQHAHKSPESRMEMLERIAEQNEKNLAAHAEEFGLPAYKAEPVEEATAEEVVDSGSEEAGEEHKEASSTEQKAKVMARVDGVDEEVEVEYLTSQYQKLRHAEKKMEEAALARKELALREKELELQRAQMLDLHARNMKELEQGQAQSAKQAEAIPSKDDSLQEAISGLFLGDEKQAAQKLNEAINAKVNAELERRISGDATKIKQEAEAAAKAALAESQRISAWENAINQAQAKTPEFKKDKDQVLGRMFEVALHDAANAGLNPYEAVEQATKSLERFLPSSNKGFKASDAELQAKEAKKAESAKFAVEGKASAVQASKSAVEKEKSMSEIIREMQEARERPRQFR